MVTPDDMEIAAEWLDSNDGDESKSCHAAAEYLRKEAARRRDENNARKVAKEHGLPVAAVRAAMRKS